MTAQVTLLYLKISPPPSAPPPKKKQSKFGNYFQQNDRLPIKDIKKNDQPLRAVYIKPVRLTLRMKLFKVRS